MDLLFAEGSKREVTQLGESAIKDLAIQDILEAISGNERDIIILKEIISSIPHHKKYFSRSSLSEASISRPRYL